MDYLQLFSSSKNSSLYGRYITNLSIEDSLSNLPKLFNVSIVGYSVLKQPIYKVMVGEGKTKVLMWSQMHGNESTTTKAVFDMFNALQGDVLIHLLKSCTLCIIPILNPDGAQAYTRLNANNVDLNRDAHNLSQPESKTLRSVFDNFKPHFCFNLHGQRTIFSAGNSSNPATLSFLSPSQDKERSITDTRKKAMELIVAINDKLQNIIPNQIGRYDDSFNINCVGDTFQTLNIPTVLFEAGHFINDYQREETRKFVFVALIESLNYLAQDKISGIRYKNYFLIPENEKLFFDIIIRNCKIKNDEKTLIKDIAIQYNEELRGKNVYFSPIVNKISDLSNFYAHKELDARNTLVLGANNEPLIEGIENDFVLLKNELLSLLPNNY